MKKETNGVFTPNFNINSRANARGQINNKHGNPGVNRRGFLFFNISIIFLQLAYINLISSSDKKYIFTSPSTSAVTLKIRSLLCEFKLTL